MIIKSTNVTTSSKSRAIVHHLIGKTDENDSIEVLWGNRGDVDDAFTNAELSNKKYGVKHFIISNLEEMTKEQFLESIDEIGKEFGFTRKNVKMAVIHGKDHHHADGFHVHFLVETVNPENNKNFDFKNYQQRQELVARTLEMDNNFQLNKGRHNKYVYSRLSESNPDYAERMKPLTEGRLERKTISEKQIENLRRRGSNPFQMKKDLKELWASSENDFDKFAEQLSGAGYSIEQGRKTLIINDRDGKFVTGVKNVLSVNDKELDTVLEGSEYSKKTIASHGNEGPQDATSPLEGVSTDTSLKASQKPQEAHKEQSQDKDQAKAQKPPEQDISSLIASVDSEKMQTSENMTNEEKQAVSFANRQETEKDELLKMQLSAQKKLIESINMKDNNKLDIKDLLSNWNTYIENESQKNKDVIEQEHPLLSHLDDNKVRNFLYKNFKDELSEFKDRRTALVKLRKEIKAHDNKSSSITGLYHGYQKNKKSEQEKEQMEQLKMFAAFLIHSMMHTVGLVKEKPSRSMYMTDAQKEYSLSQYKRNEYAQMLVKHADQSRAINAVSTMAVYHRNGEIEDFKNREEAQDAKEQLRKLDKIKNFDMSLLSDDEKSKLDEHIENFDINKVNSLITDHNLRIMKQEREKDISNEIHENVENNVEHENPDEIEKNIYRKNVKNKGMTFNR